MLGFTLTFKKAGKGSFSSHLVKEQGRPPRELRMREQTLGGRLSEPEAPGDPQQRERSATGLLRESPPDANSCHAMALLYTCW